MIPETVLDRIRALVDKPLDELRRVMAGYDWDESPTKSEIRLSTEGKSRGELVVDILDREYNG